MIGGRAIPKKTPYGVFFGIAAGLELISLRQWLAAKKAGR